MPQTNRVIVVRFLLVLVLATAASDCTPTTSFSNCSEYIANDGYGYRRLFDVDELGRRDVTDGHLEVPFLVRSKQALQILLTTEPAWPGRTGTPYEIQIYNNQVFMLNRHNRMVTKVNRNYILDERIAVPMVLRIYADRDGTNTTTIELQVIGELQPFIRYVDSRAAIIGTITHLAFGTHGPNVAHYLYGCPAGGVHDASTWAAAVIEPLPTEPRPAARQCANGVRLQSVDGSPPGASSPSSVPLSQLALSEASANETLIVRLYAQLAVGQSTVRLILHARSEYGSVGSPFYAIELGDAYTLWRSGLLVATRRPNQNLLESGIRTLVTVSIKTDGSVNIWLNDLVSQKLHFLDAYPIDLRYIAFEYGHWSFAECA